jgi:hypothetical protein
VAPHPYAKRLAKIEESRKWLETIPCPAGEKTVVVNIRAFQLFESTAADRGIKPLSRCAV